MTDSILSIVIPARSMRDDEYKSRSRCGSISLSIGARGRGEDVGMVGRPFPLYGGFIETHARFEYIDEDNGE